EGKFAEALPRLQASLGRSRVGDSIVRKLYAMIAQCHRQLGQAAGALAACQEGRRHYPDDVELIFQESLARRALKDLAGAEACLLRVLNSRQQEYFASVDAGLRGYKARYNLAVIYRDAGRLAEAEAQWRLVLDERPDFVPAMTALAETYLGQERWPAFEEMVARLEK